MKSISKEEFVKIESINRQLKRAKSPRTYINWMNSLYKFFKVIDTFPDDFVRLSKDEIEDRIEAYVDSLKQIAKDRRYQHKQHSVLCKSPSEFSKHLTGRWHARSMEENQSKFS